MREDFVKFREYIKGKKAAVLGIGVSNRPLIRYISRMGASVTACDKMTREKLGSVCDEMESMDIKLQLGPGYLNNIDGFDIIFRTPSLRPDLPELVSARNAGAYITSEIEEFLKYCPGEIIGVTGSDGKTTTTTLIYNILKEEGYKVWLGGNIGYPLFDKLEEISKEDKVVLELSSFQLMTASVSPDISVITNLSPNHLDIHKSMEEYVESKKNIYRYQDKNGLLVINLDNDITRSLDKEAKGKVRFFTRLSSVKNGAYLKDKELVLARNNSEMPICTMDEVRLPGLHNIENLLAAFSAVSDLCSPESMGRVARTFNGVEHRMEFVREVDGIKFYNDSMASSPTRTSAGIRAFKQKVILIAGGYDKKIPFDELARAGMDKVKTLILIGVTAKKIEEAFRMEMEKTGVEISIIYASTLENAVRLAKENGKTGDIITLSPACASFDMFKDFAERGNKFKEIVNKI